MSIKNRLLLTILSCIGSQLVADNELEKAYQKFLNENKRSVEIICNGLAAIYKKDKNKFDEFDRRKKECDQRNEMITLIKKLPEVYSSLVVRYSNVPNAVQPIIATTLPRDERLRDLCSKEIWNYCWGRLGIQVYLMIISGQQELTDEQQYYLENLPQALLDVSKKEKELFDVLREKVKGIEALRSERSVWEQEIVKVYPDYIEVTDSALKDKNKELCNDLKIGKQKIHERHKGVRLGWTNCETLFVDNKEGCDLCVSLVAQYASNCILQNQAKKA